MSKENGPSPRRDQVFPNIPEKREWLGRQPMPLASKAMQAVIFFHASQVTAEFNAQAGAFRFSNSAADAALATGEQVPF